MTTKRTIACPSCKASINASEKLAGKQVKCPKCSQTFSVLFANEETVQSGGSNTDTSESSASEFEKKTVEKREAVGRLGRFELRNILGQGAFGRVYQAYDPQLDRLLALKVPIFGKDESKKAARFQAEAKAAGRLRHPNIVPVFDSGCVDGQYFIATQYIDGQTLAQEIRENGEAGIDFGQAAAWAKAIASALAYAHHVGIVHRDVKPHNVMLDSRNEPQLMDFGLAKRVNEDSAMTTEGALLGTPAYMAPEQARGDTSKVGPQSDQYAIGAVLYELLTGRRPFEGPPHAVLAQILSVEPPSPKSLRSTVPRDLEAIALKAMSKEAAHRYESCEALAEDLDRWIRGEATEARPISALERLSRWSKRNRSLSALTLGTVGVILIALIGVTSAFFQANAARKLAAENLTKAQEQTRLASEAEAKALATAHELSQALEEVKREKERAVAAEELAKANAMNAEKALRDLQTAQNETSQKVLEVEIQSSRADSLREETSRLEKSAITGRYQQLVQSIYEAIENHKPSLAKSIFDQGKKGASSGWEWRYLGKLIGSSMPTELKPSESPTLSKAVLDSLLRNAIAVRHVSDGSRVVVLGKERVGLFEVATGKFLAYRDIPGGISSLSRVLDCVPLENSLLFLCWAGESSYLIRVQNDNFLQTIVSEPIQTWSRGDYNVEQRLDGSVVRLSATSSYLCCGAISPSVSGGAGIGVINSVSFTYQITSDRIQVKQNKTNDQAVFCDVVGTASEAFLATNFDSARRGSGMATVDTEAQFQRIVTELRSLLRNGRVTQTLIEKYPLEVQCGPWFNKLVPNLTAVSITNNGTYLGSSDGKFGYLSTSTKSIKPLAGFGSQINTISISENGTTLALGLEDRTVRIVNSNGFAEVESISAQDYPVVSTSLSADGKSLMTFRSSASGSNASLHTIGTTNGLGRKYEFKLEKGINISGARLIDDQANKCFALVTSKGNLILVEVTEEKVNQKTVSKTDQIAPTLSHDGKCFAGLDPIKAEILVVELSNVQKPRVNRIKWPNYWVQTLASSNDRERQDWIDRTRLFVDSQRRILFVVSPLYALEAYDFSGVFLFRRTDVKLQNDRALFLTPNGQHLVTQNTVLGTKSELAEVEAHGSRDRPFVLLDKQLISASNDSIISCSVASKPSKQAEFVGHIGAVTHVIASSKGDRIFSASEDRTVRIWDTQTNQQLLKLYTSDQPIADIDLSADDNLLLITKVNGEAILLDASP